MAECDYEIKAGDCMNSIAYEHGFLWKTLWNHPQNADLKQKRADPNVLLEGDVVHIPDKREKQETGATEQRHRFKRKGVPARFRVRLLRDDEPLANQPFELLVDGTSFKGTTGGNGLVDAPLVPNATEGVLNVGEGADRQTFYLSFGQINPLDTDSGVAGRLADLGYCVEPDLGPAVRAFQAKYKLPETGQIDDATRQKLKEVFGH